MAVLFPCVAPKPLPVIVTDMPIGPLLEEMELIESDPSGVNCTPLLVTPPAVTVTGPLVAFDGTLTTTVESLQELTLAVTLLNWTVLLPCVGPKPLPDTMTDAPVGALEGVR